MFTKSEIEVLKLAIENKVRATVTETNGFASYYPDRELVTFTVCGMCLRGNVTTFDYENEMIHIFYDGKPVGYVKFETD